MSKKNDLSLFLSDGYFSFTMMHHRQKLHFLPLILTLFSLAKQISLYYNGFTQ